MEEPPELKPGERPLFCTPELTVGMGYPGVVEPDLPPNFDYELAESLEALPTETGGHAERYRRVARYHAAGLRNTEIAKRMGYTSAGIAKILKQGWVQTEVSRYRKALDNSLSEKLKEAATDGLELVHRIINDEEEKTATRLDAAKWMVEKTHGKARQEVTVESGTLGSFMELIKEMKSTQQAIDVTPAKLEHLSEVVQIEAAPQEQNKFDAWIDQNLSPA